jgi:spore maturation protein CgeB
MKIIHIGQLGNQHTRRKRLIEYLRSNGINIETPVVWGKDYYKATAEADIALNCHGDGVEYACNHRLFEVTGMGTCLVTDQLKGLDELFVVQKEVISYKSFKNCLGALRYLIFHPNARAKIARNGQRRTLKDHTFKQRMKEWNKILT